MSTITPYCAILGASFS